MRRQSDVRLRGMSVYTVGTAQALALAEQDPMVAAGHLRIEVASWCVGAGKVEFPLHDGEVGERLSFEEMSELD
ncbi:hypothetical protein ACPPVT_19600 [Angustibacter sp. McL0619]|uniref:hypothetical protein n=1 Tax=Angustibacter sp. McL0619 TaxID=3415676 RepID=UPI003CF00609